MNKLSFKILHAKITQIQKIETNKNLFQEIIKQHMVPSFIKNNAQRRTLCVLTRSKRDTHTASTPSAVKKRKKTLKAQK